MLAVAALAVATLIGFTPLAVRELAWSDELVYAVMGRNIADGREVISGYYAAPAIIAKGHPLGDVHPPGFALLLAAAFLALGVTPEVALVPAGLALVLAAAWLFWLGRSIGGPTAGGLAALLLVWLPGAASYAHTAMPELPILLVSVAILASWWRSFDHPSPAAVASLAIAICAGMLLRETLLVSLLPVAWLLGRCWTSGRRLPIAVFVAVFMPLLLSLALPLLANRAPYPHFVSDVLALDGLGPRLGALFDRAGANLRAVVELAGDARHWGFLWLLALGVLLPMVSLSRPEPESRLARYTLLCGLPTLLVLVWVYPLHTGAGLRALLFLAPPALLLLSLRLLALPKHRLAASALVAAASLLVSIAAARTFGQDRLAFMRYDRPFSQLVERATRDLEPRSVIAENAFAFGWLAYPVDVIWQASARPAEVAALERHLPIDAIFVGAQRRDELLSAVAAGELKGGYSVASEPAPGVFLLVGARGESR